ncbi:hypothetical protein BOX15_Mlig027846g1, partial [Macrostomum lignano]
PHKPRLIKASLVNSIDMQSKVQIENRDNPSTGLLLDEPIVALGVSRLSKPTTASFFNRSQQLQTKSASIDTKDERQKVQSMYLAAVEPLFSLVASYRRLMMDEDLWDGVYFHTFGNSKTTVRPYWHRLEVSESLVRYWDSIVHRLGVTDSSLSKRGFYVLVPMCGCSKDLVWLYRQGVCVTGIDSNQRVVNAFISSNPDLKLERCLLPSGTLFCRTSDRRLRIFVCNFFTCSSYLDHHYNFVWDRCAFACLNVDQRKAYVRQLMHCRAENFHILIETVEYDPTVFPLPPHPVFLGEIRELFGRHLRIENVSRSAVTLNWKSSVMKEPFRQLFGGPFMPTDWDPFPGVLQVALMCNEL